jgi:hypothetical protein
MTFIITTFAGMGFAVSGALFSYEHKESSLIVLMFALTLSVMAIVVWCKENSAGKHHIERKIILNSALEIIDARTRLTVELIGKFRDDFKKYRYSLSEEQREFMSNLLNTVEDVRINNAELECDTLSTEERKQFISENRANIDKIEKAREVIEGYLRKST